MASSCLRRAVTSLAKAMVEKECVGPFCFVLSLNGHGTRKQTYWTSCLNSYQYKYYAKCWENYSECYTGIKIVYSETVVSSPESIINVKVVQPQMPWIFYKNPVRIQFVLYTYIPMHIQCKSARKKLCKMTMTETRQSEIPL